MLFLTVTGLALSFYGVVRIAKMPDLRVWASKKVTELRFVNSFEAVSVVRYPNYKDNESTISLYKIIQLRNQQRSCPFRNEGRRSGSNVSPYFLSMFRHRIVPSLAQASEGVFYKPIICSSSNGAIWQQVYE